MNLLVAYASKHGSTREIATVIAEELRQSGMEIALHPASDVVSIEDYDGIVLGSAIYVGQWQKDTVEFIDKHEESLESKPVWLFSSGPIGEDPFPVDEPPATAELVARTGATEHRSFAGKLDRGSLGVGERIIATVVRAPEGDFRDWDAIRAWAGSIANKMSGSNISNVRTGV